PEAVRAPGGADAGRGAGRPGGPGAVLLAARRASRPLGAGREARRVRLGRAPSPPAHPRVLAHGRAVGVRPARRAPVRRPRRRPIAGRFVYGLAESIGAPQRSCGTRGYWELTTTSLVPTTESVP